MKQPTGQSRDWPVFFCSLLLCSGLPAAFGKPTSDGLRFTDARAAIAEAERLELSAETRWRQLLQFDNAKQSSRVISEDFFLAPSGAKSPDAELRASIRAFFAPPGDDPNGHAACRFPGRHYWLSRYLGELGQLSPLTDCPRLGKWAKFADLESISLILISGYFGNPASSFGHSILRLNNGDAAQGLTLLDVGINYGALVPENEWMPLYVVRGLFGGYQAGYSDRLYYTQDQSYARLEFRDMWEYELNLPPEQLTLLVLHLWEVVGRKFQYQFLKQNCAYRLAELMELATGQDYLSSVDIWYAPVSLFHQLQHFDQESGGQLISNIHWRPSSQRVLFDGFARLSAHERALANGIVAEQLSLDSPAMAALADARRAAVLEVLLDYYQYRLVGEAQDTQAPPVTELTQRKDAVLRARLALPGSLTPRVLPQALPSPAAGTPPSRVGLGIGYGESAKAFAALTATAFNYDRVGRNNLQGSELVVADLEIGLSENNSFFLRQLDFARASKLNRLPVRIHGESLLSWSVRTGIKRDDLSCTGCLELYAEAGIGRSWQVAEPLAVTVGANLSAETKSSPLVLQPNIGLRFQPLAIWASYLQVDYRAGNNGSEERVRLNLQNRLSLSARDELRLVVDHNDGTEASLSWQRSW